MSVIEQPLADYDVEQVRRDFPILSTTVRGKRLAFLDTAASSQRPASVIEAIVHYETHLHANVHRGVYELSQKATDAFEAARERVRQRKHIKLLSRGSSRHFMVFRRVFFKLFRRRGKQFSLEEDKDRG